jgi:hypothetical protein
VGLCLRRGDARHFFARWPFFCRVIVDDDLKKTPKKNKEVVASDGQTDEKKVELT